MSYPKPLKALGIPTNPESQGLLCVNLRLYQLVQRINYYQVSRVKPIEELRNPLCSPPFFAIVHSQKWNCRKDKDLIPMRKIMRKPKIQIGEGGDNVQEKSNDAKTKHLFFEIAAKNTKENDPQNANKIPVGIISQKTTKHDCGSLEHPMQGTPFNDDQGRKSHCEAPHNAGGWKRCAHA